MKKNLIRLQSLTVLAAVALMMFPSKIEVLADEVDEGADAAVAAETKGLLPDVSTDKTTATVTGLHGSITVEAPETINFGELIIFKGNLTQKDAGPVSIVVNNELASLPSWSLYASMTPFSSSIPLVKDLSGTSIVLKNPSVSGAQAEGRTETDPRISPSPFAHSMTKLYTSDNKLNKGETAYTATPELNINSGKKASDSNSWAVGKTFKSTIVWTVSTI